jgi:hypothetical protein
LLSGSLFNRDGGPLRLSPSREIGDLFRAGVWRQKWSDFSSLWIWNEMLNF